MTSLRDHLLRAACRYAKRHGHWQLYELAGHARNTLMRKEPTS